MTDIGNAPDAIDREVRAALSSPTWCHVLVSNTLGADRVAMQQVDHVSRRVRGRKMRTWATVFDEFAAAWQFGDYFGENGMALHECLGDLHDVWATTSGFAVLISEPQEVLADDEGRPSDPSLGGLIGIFGDTSDWYGEPVPGPPGDVNARPALSFDVFLVTDAEHRDEVVRRWRAAGAPLD